MRNQIAEKSPTHKGLTAGKIARILKEVTADTGIIVSKEVQRRFLYSRKKTWRVHFEATYQGKHALLKIESLKLEIDEESIREQFRTAAKGRKVRPPMTYAFAPFDDEKGYAWSIDEFVEGEPLFAPDADPSYASERFMPFYKEVCAAVHRPFWKYEDPKSFDAEAFSVAQLDAWKKLAMKRNPECVTRNAEILERLSERIITGMKRHLLGFVHAHSAGSDIRVVGDEYVVFANEFWSLRQPGYCIAFPIWNQWLALHDEHRSHADVQRITDAWLATIQRELVPKHYLDTECIRVMLLNRIYGSLILDLPAQRRSRSAESVAALEAALITEANRLMAM